MDDAPTLPPQQQAFLIVIRMRRRAPSEIVEPYRAATRYSIERRSRQISSDKSFAGINEDSIDRPRCLGSPGHMTDDNSGQHHRRSTIERIKELVARMKAEKGEIFVRRTSKAVWQTASQINRWLSSAGDGRAWPPAQLSEKGTASAGGPSSRGRQSGHFQSVHGRDTFITGLRSDLFLSGEKIHCRRSRLNCTKVYRYASAAYRLGSGA